MLRVKYERVRRGLSQDTLAVLAGRLSQPDIGLIENGRLIPTTAQLERLAAIFGVPPDALLLPVEVVEEKRA